MRTKQLVACAALVALLSGGLAMAADGTRDRAGNSGVPGLTDLDPTNGWTSPVVVAPPSGQQRKGTRQAPAPPPVVLQDFCTQSPVVSGLAGLFGFSDLMPTCQPRS